MRVVKPQLRLETLGSTGVRTILGTTYITVIVALVLAGATQLGYNTRHIDLGGGLLPCVNHPNNVPPPNTGCIRNVTRPTGEVWIEYSAFVTQMSQLAGGFIMDIQPTEPSQIPMSRNVKLEYAIAISGTNSQNVSYDPTVQHSPDWRRVYSQGNTSHEFSCLGNGFCPVISLFDTTSSSWGSGSGGFTNYWITVYFSSTNVVNMFGNFEFQLSYRRAVYRIFAVAIRSALLLATMIVLGLWIHRINKFYHQSEESDTACTACRRCCCGCGLFTTWLPQRRWMLWLLIAMFFWQNPLFVTTQLLPNVNTDLSMATEMLSSAAWSAVFAIWLLMVDGLRQLDMTQSYGFRFYAPKVGFGVLLALVSISIHLLQQPQLIMGQVSASKPFASAVNEDHILIAILILGSIYLSMLFFWFVWFFKTAVNVKKVLKNFPYSATRFQQLVFRFFCWQLGVVVFFSLVINAIPVIQWLIRVQKSGKSTDQIPQFNATSVANDALYQSQHQFVMDQVFFNDVEYSDTIGSSTLSSVVQSVSVGYQPVGAYILVSIYAYLLAYCYLPPHGQEAPSNSTLDKIEDGISRLFGVVLGAGTDNVRQAFSLETASWMFDFAWAAYYDPSGIAAIDAHDTPENDLSTSMSTLNHVRTNVSGNANMVTTTLPNKDDLESATATQTLSGFGPMEETPHGFEIEGFVYSNFTDTVAIVFRQDWRVVVAFRGTASAKNIATDLKFLRGSATFAVSDLSEQHQYAGTIPGVRQVFPLLHRGFSTAYESIRSRFRSILKTALVSAGPRARLYCTGHSLGGALATIAAYDCRALVEENRTAFAMTSGVSNRLSGRQGPSASRMIGQVSSLFEGVASSVVDGVRSSLRKLRVISDEEETEADVMNNRDRSALRSSLMESEEESAASLSGGRGDGRLASTMTTTTRNRPSNRNSSNWLPAFRHGSSSDDSEFDRSAPHRRADHGRVRVRTSSSYASPPLNPAGIPEIMSGIPNVSAGESQIHDTGNSKETLESQTPRNRATLFDKLNYDSPDAAVGLSPHDSSPSYGPSDPTNRRRSAYGAVARYEEHHDDEDSKHDVIVYTFGSPRVGNRRFARQYNLRVPCTFRIASDGDLITGIPKFLFMFKHVGIRVWLDILGNVIVDPSFVETQFVTKRNTSFKAHSMATYKAGLLQARLNQGLPISQKILQELEMSQEDLDNAIRMSDIKALTVDYQ